MNKKGYTGIELLIVIGVIGVIFFVGANQVSSTFDIDYNKELYDQTIETIEKTAEVYAEVNKELFSESTDIYLTVGELVEKNTALASSEGVVSDPRDNNKNLNDLKVKLSLTDDNVTAKVLG